MTIEATDPRVTLHRACLILSDRDPDRAGEQNSIGWNGTDSNFGHVLADRDPQTWSPKMTAIARKMLVKYRKQLVSAGMSEADLYGALAATATDLPTVVSTGFNGGYAPVPANTPATFEVPPRERYYRIELDGGTMVDANGKPTALIVRFPYDRPVLDKIRGLHSRTYDPGARIWRVPLNDPIAVDQLAAIAAEEQFHIAGDAADAINKALEQVREAERAREAAIAASAAHEADIDVPGLGVTLKPFQRAGVAYILAKDSRVLVADEQGLGKTIEALAVIQHHLRDAPLARALVVCPASLKINWIKEAIRALPEIVTLDPDHRTLFAGVSGYDHGWRVKGATILNGRTSDIEFKTTDHRNASVTTNDLRARLLIVNYDILDKHAEMLTRLKTSGVLRVIVFDESHYIKNNAAKRTELSQIIAKDIPARLLMTGTPVMNRPKELISQLFTLGRLDDFGGFHAFVRNYCRVDYVGAMGSATNDPALAPNMDPLKRLNDALRATCFLRRRKADVLSELDPKVRTMIPLDITNRAEYDRCEADLIAHLREKAQNDTAFHAKIRAEMAEMDFATKGEADAYFQQAKTAYEEERAAAGAGPAYTLVLIENLKQIAARGKLAAVCEWIEDFLESGEKLVTFVTHKEIAHTIASRFKAPLIIGDTPLGERNRIVEAFQTDPAARLVVANLQSGGTGLTLTAASNVAIIEFPWSPSVQDQAEDRCHRIGQKDSVTVWEFAGQRTIDEDIRELLDAKRRMVAASTDGIAPAANESILGDLVERLLNK